MSAPKAYRIGGSFIDPGSGDRGVICGYVLDRNHEMVIKIQVRLRPGPSGTVEIALPKNSQWRAG